MIPILKCTQSVSVRRSLLVGAVLMSCGFAGAQGTATPQTISVRCVVPALPSERVVSLADEFAAASGADRVSALVRAYAALCAERNGGGEAPSLLREMAEEDGAALLNRLSDEDLYALLALLDDLGLAAAVQESPLYEALMLRLAVAIRHGMEEEASGSGAGAASGSGGYTLTLRRSWAERAWEEGKLHGELMPSVWWLKHASGSILQEEPVDTGAPPFGSGRSGHGDSPVVAPGKGGYGVAITLPATFVPRTFAAASTASVSAAGGFGGGASGASSGGSASGGGADLSRYALFLKAKRRPVSDPEEEESEEESAQERENSRPLLSTAEEPMPQSAPLRLAAAPAAELPSIEVADGTSQSVMNPTTVSSISLGKGSTLYVADTLTLQQGGTLSVQENGTLLVKDGGKVILNQFTDGDEASAKLFDAFVKAAKTEGSGIIQIENASVQFGTDYYHLPIGEDHVNAVFDAHFEVRNNLTLQNYWLGKQGEGSLWEVGANGQLHIAKDLYVSSYQTLVVKDGSVTVDGVAHLGHSDAAKYASALEIRSGSVTLGQIKGETAGASTVSMSGGTLQVTHEGNAFVNGIGKVDLSGGTLVAQGNNWTLNHSSSVGDIGVETDATHTITLGASGTTTTLTGDVTINEGSQAALNGLYSGTGTVMLEEGSSLTLGQNFGTTDGSSVGLAGSGSVKVNWVGTPGELHDGFAESYDITYRPAGLEGGMNLDDAAGLIWKDAANNILHNVSYQNGVLTGYITADPGAYHIVSAGHRAVYDQGGNAAEATSFLLYNDGKLFIGKDRSVSASQVTQNGHDLTLQGSGDYVLGGHTLSQPLQFEAAGENQWTGAVVISGSVDGNKVQSFDNFYRQGSVIAMNGFDGIPGEWLSGTLSAGIRLDAQADGSAAWRWNSGTTGGSPAETTFSGDWSGEGDFVLGAVNGKAWNQNFVYTGDISGWTGHFLAESGTSTVTFSGAKKQEVNASFDKVVVSPTIQAYLNILVNNDVIFNANVTVNDLAVKAGKSVEVGRDAVVDLTPKTYGAVAFDSLVDALTGAGVVKMNGGEYQMGGTTVTGQAHDFKTNYVFTGNQGLTLADYGQYDKASWNVVSDAVAAENEPVKNGSITVQKGDLWLHNRQTLNIKGGAVNVENGYLKLGYSEPGATYTAYASMDRGSLTAQGLHFITGVGTRTISGKPATSFTMTGGTLNITGSTFAKAGSDAAAKVDISGGTLLADNHAWTLNYNSTIGNVSIVTQGEQGAIILGTQGVTTTLSDMLDNRGTLTLDGTVDLTMAACNTANAFVDQDHRVNFNGVGFAATVTMPGEVYNVVSGNAAAVGEHLAWTANGQKLTVVAESEKGSAPEGALYFDGFNLRPVKDSDDPVVTRTGTVYHMGARGEIIFSDEAAAAIVTGFELTGRGGRLVVSVSPEQHVSLDLAAGQLELADGVEITVGKDQSWSMEAGASLVLGKDAVLTLPGVWGETTPNSYQDSYNVYHLLNNTRGDGKVVFEGDVSWQFGNAGHNTVSTGSYNILDEYGDGTGVNADIRFDLEVQGDLLIQNYRQGKDHPEPGSWWKVSEGGSLTVHGDFESSSFQKVSVKGGAVVVDGTYKIGHEAGGEYEGDLELKSGSLTVGTLQTVHEGTSAVYLSGGRFTVTSDKAFANTFREVSACDTEFDGNWTWNHSADIGNITITEGSAITLGTADTRITLESPIAANNGSLKLDGTIVAKVQATPGIWAYGTDATGYTPDGDGYYKHTDDLYTLISEGNNASLGENLIFQLNGQVLQAGEFNWDGKSIGMGGTEAGTVYYLNTDKGYTYTADDTRTTAFELLNTGATLRLERDLSALETIHALGGTVSLGSGVSMEAALLEAENTVTMAGEGTYIVSGNTLMAHPDAHHVNFGDASWRGTVQMSGMLGTEGTLNALGNAGSWVEMKGVFGDDSADSLDINVKLSDTSGTPAWIYTGDGHDVAFTGDWGGAGTFAFAPVNEATQKLTFSGDLAAWTGAFSAQGGTAQLEFAGEASVIEADLRQEGGKIEISAAVDTHFTGSVSATSLTAEGGNIVLDHTNTATINRLRATGGDITLDGLSAAASLTVDELVIGDGRKVTALAEDPAAPAPETPDTEVCIVIDGETAQLTAGIASGVHADLGLGDGVSLQIADREEGLRVEGGLTLGGSGMELDASMKEYLTAHKRLVLFSGVTELTLSDGTVIRDALTAWDQVQASDYFNGLLERLNAESGSAGGTSYYITYSGSANGGEVCIETPEPITSLFSLIALAAAAVRRRRA